MQAITELPMTSAVEATMKSVETPKKKLIRVVKEKIIELPSIEGSKTETCVNIVKVEMCKPPKEKLNHVLKEKIIETKNESYTAEILKEQYNLHKRYVECRKKATKNCNVKVRFPCIPEDISENIIKNIIHNKLKDKSSSWDCKKGDLYSLKEGKQECKCFTSNGPISFTPTSEWDVLYFLDARKWLNDIFILYKVNLKKTSSEWKNIKVNKSETFQDHCDQKRRPRIGWEGLKGQLSGNYVIVYAGGIFIESEVMM